MNHSNRLIKNILSNYAGVLIPSAILLFLTPFMIKKLGVAAYGIWIVANSLKSYFQVMELGIRTSVIKFISQYHAADEKKKIEELLSTSFYVFLLIGIISLFALKIIANFSPDIFKIPPDFSQTIKTIIGIFGINVAIVFLNRILEGALVGLQRYDLISLLNILSEALNAVLTVLLLLSGFGIISLALLSLFVSVSVFFIQLTILKAYYGFGIKLSRFRWQTIKSILDFSFFSFILEIASKVTAKMDSLIIGIFMPVAAITNYIIGVKLASIAEKLTDPMVDIFFPFSSELSANRDREGLQRLLIEGTRSSALIAFPLVAFLFLSDRAAVALWVGKEYHKSVIILDIFLMISVFTTLEATASRILLGIGKLRFTAAVSIISTLVNLFLSLILIKSLGLKGVALGTLIPLSISSLFLVIPYTCAMINLSVKELIKRSLIPPLIPIVPVFFFLIFLNNLLGLEGINKLFVNAAVIFPFYFIIFFKFCLSGEERGFYADMLRDFLKGKRIFRFFSGEGF
ncbi:MAG: hypothetical protein A3H37_10510 [Candidatus Schekmanbacteria bacterium RIFCSPLOWO2_02_FULL_38_14]|nr:MAG: hypothetical protein A3H37_10510 [Candidatus Schekmanbacteria bacterium RIFCSPLOWO2_02_FULL_38_14]